MNIAEPIGNQLALPIPDVSPVRVLTLPTHSLERAGRFTQKVIQTAACHWWIGAISDDGYGRFWYRKDDGVPRTVSAHRFAWELHQPPDTPVDREINLLHYCNNTLCVRISDQHVYSGTQAENIRYADRLGRRRGRRPVNGADLLTTVRNQRLQLLAGSIPDREQRYESPDQDTLF